MSKFVLTALVALAAAGSAQAVVTVTSTNGPDNLAALPAGQTVIYNFDTTTPVAPNIFGNYKIVQGSLTGINAAPLGDTTKYLSVPGIGTTGSATIVFDQSYRTLSFYWGSIDAYNSVTYLTASGVSLGTFTGDKIPSAPADGSQGNALNNRRVNWDFGADAVKSIVLTSTSNSFELDDIAGAAATSSPTPEPTTWAMLAAGIGMVGASMRGRRRTRAVTA